ncbi:PxKF domain-containing protein [Gaiella sp.]|uniref:PxKF domain-containing protein n=1 Tax=Gaiella sp. TaxID=2663207 RepID=UPI0039C888F7
MSARTRRDGSSIKSLRAGEVACDATASVDDIEASATRATTLRYDATAGQFVYNWQTPKQPGRCYSVTMTTQDGSSLVAFFRLK